MSLIQKETLKDCLLIATPSIPDTRFSRTVSYIFHHDETGAAGIVINVPCDGFSFSELRKQLNLEGKGKDFPIFDGGPVENHKGFVLHSTDYLGKDTLVFPESGVALTSTVDVLRALSQGEGPQDSFIALGYAGWRAGQLEQEMARNGWLYCNADTDILFHTPVTERWEKSLIKAGVSLPMLWEAPINQGYIC